MRSVDAVELGDRQLRRLERHRAEPDKAVGMLGADLGDEIVDLARHREAEIGVGAVIGLARRRRDRLDVDPHQVHVGDALLGRAALLGGAYAVGAVLRLALRAGLGFEIPARDRLVALDHLGRLVAAHMAMDVDRVPLAARVGGAGEASGYRRAGWAAGKQHLEHPPVTATILPAFFGLTADGARRHARCNTPIEPQEESHARPSRRFVQSRARQGRRAGAGDEGALRHLCQGCRLPAVRGVPERAQPWKTSRCSNCGTTRPRSTPMPNCRPCARPCRPACAKAAVRAKTTPTARHGREAVIASPRVRAFARPEDRLREAISIRRALPARLPRRADALLAMTTRNRRNGE